MKVDLLGLAAVITASGAFVGVIGSFVIQMKTLKSVEIVKSEQKIVHKAVNSNMDAMIAENKRLHLVATEKAEDKIDDDLARNEGTANDNG